MGNISLFAMWIFTNYSRQYVNMRIYHYMNSIWVKLPWTMGFSWHKASIFICPFTHSHMSEKNQTVMTLMLTWTLKWQTVVKCAMYSIWRRKLFGIRVDVPYKSSNTLQVGKQFFQTTPIMSNYFTPGCICHHTVPHDPCKFLHSLQPHHTGSVGSVLFM